MKSGKLKLAILIGLRCVLFLFFSNINSLNPKERA